MVKAESKQENSGLPRWLPWTGVALSIAGIAVSTDLTIAHYTTPALLACPETGVINCAKVTTSSYATLFGVPLALLGLLFFVAMLVAQLPPMWRITKPLVKWGRLAFASSGLLFIFYLLYVELFRLNAICLYCTAVHILTVALFILTAVGTAFLADEH